MKIQLKVERSTRSEREWMASASVPDVFTVRRYAVSQIQARERVLSTALRRVYEVMEDGELALADVFPLVVAEDLG